MKKVNSKSVYVRLPFFLLPFLLLVLAVASCEKDDTTPPAPPPVEAHYTTDDVAGTYTMAQANWSGFVGGTVGSIWTWTAVSQDSLNDGYINIGLTSKGKLSAPPQTVGTLIVSFEGQYSPKKISGTFTIKNGQETSSGYVIMTKP